MHTLHLFTDGSVNPQSKVGYGAYIVVEDIYTAHQVLDSHIKLNRFEMTGSVQLELLTWIWAVEKLLMECDPRELVLNCYTDSQNITTLPSRRLHLEGCGYTNNRQKSLRHAECYKMFFDLTDRLHCNFIQVAGHKPKANRDPIDHLFARVDRAVRNATRKAAFRGNRTNLT